MNDPLEFNQWLCRTCGGELWEGEECDGCITSRKAIEAEHRRDRKLMRRKALLQIRAFIYRRTAA